MKIQIDDLNGPEIAELLAQHLQCMADVSPPESRHALDLDGLRKPEITFWSVWEGRELAGCGALKELSAEHGEIKSMRTAGAYLRKGVAEMLLEHMIAEAKRRGYRSLSLETGSMEYFEPARKLYFKFGFRISAPFAGYIGDPNSVFMSRDLMMDVLHRQTGTDHLAQKGNTAGGEAADPVEKSPMANAR